MDEIEFNPIGLIDRAALVFLKSKKLLPSFAYEDVWMHEHAVAFTVAKMLDADLLAEVKSALEPVHNLFNNKAMKARLVN